jgi:LmbE family N-acetylglucosaminyl deacetylase
MRVLAIGAHPDDVDLLCGGTLALCAARGDEVTIAVATNGEVGSGEPDAKPADVARVREAEARASASVIGASLLWMGFPDEFLFDDRSTREKFIDTIRQVQPEILFIHSESDYHPDHRIAGKIARDSRIPVSVELVKTGFPRTEIPTTFLMDTYKGRNFEPETFVDISSVIEKKKTMLAAHDSQNAWMRHVFNTDMAAGMVVQSRFRGEQAGVEHAEGFQLLKDWPHAGDWSLLP